MNWIEPLINVLSDAERELSKLATLSSSYPFPLLLTHLFVRREAVLSSRIEGTRASLIDLYDYEASQLSFLGEASDVNEVFNYVRALDYGLARLKELPVSLRLIREIQAKLMEGVSVEISHRVSFVAAKIGSGRLAALSKQPPMFYRL